MDFERFQEFLLIDLTWSPVTVEKMSRRLRAIHKAGVRLDPLDEKAARAYLRQRLMTGSSPFAYNNDVKALNAIYRWQTGAERGAFRKRKVPPSQYKYLSDADVRKVLQYRHRDPEVERFRRGLTLWALKSGMRVGEVHAMNTTDLNPEASQFLVRRPSKLGSRRILPVERWVWSPKRPFGAYLSKRQAPPTDPEAVWTLRPNGQKVARRAPVSELRAALAAVGKQAGVPLNFVITRHTRGTELNRYDWPLQRIQFYLGHAKPSTTAIYVAVRSDDLFRQMRKRPGRDFFQGEPE